MAIDKKFETNMREFCGKAEDKANLFFESKERQKLQIN